MTFGILFRSLARSPRHLSQQPSCDVVSADMVRFVNFEPLPTPN